MTTNPPQANEDSELCSCGAPLLPGFERCPRCAYQDRPAADPDHLAEGETRLIDSEAGEATDLPQAGDQIGRYRLIEELGRGGMGMVFRAQQTEPVAREVAIKFIKWGMDTREVVARFEAERQALALMEHQNIARVFDGGATDTGRPFFVMELVRGERITAYCDRLRLDALRRIRLFQQVCDGVQHAHQKGLIHRDLKPSNIVVTEGEDRGIPKVIDFGVAKAVGGQLGTETVYTQAGQLIGTPSYMSPEQAAGGLDIDTRTDVYSLGALLYELLTGVSPWTRVDGQRSDRIEVFEKIRSEDPVLPSSRVSTTTDSANEWAARRGTDPSSLRGQLRGDLDWIVMKALARDRGQRYRTPADLKDDLDRHLRHEPVSAGPPTLRYRTAKFLRRHRGGVAAAAVLLAALIAGMFGTSLGLVRARAAEAVAAAEADKASAVSGFLQDVLGSPDPYNRQGGDVTVLEALSEAEGRIEDAFGDQPETRAAVQYTLGSTYERLGTLDRARSMLTSALAARSSSLGASSLETLEAQVRLGKVHRLLNENDPAEALLTEAVERYRAMPAGRLRDQGLSAAIDQLGWLRMDQSKFAEARPLFEEALSIRRVAYDRPAEEIANSLSSLGASFANAGDYDAAIDSHRHALEERQQLHGPRSVSAADSMASLGQTLSAAAGNAVTDDARADELRQEGERYLVGALAIQKEVLGEHHPVVVNTLNGLANSRHRQGDAAGALEAFRELVPISRAVFGNQHLNTARALYNLGSALLVRGRAEEDRSALDEAREVLREAIEINESLFGGEHAVVGLSYGTLAQVELQRGEVRTALRLSDRAAGILEGALGSEHWRTASLLSLRGEALTAAGRYAEAEALLLECHERLVVARGAQSAGAVSTRERLVELYRRWGRSEDAARWENAPAA